MEEKKAVSNATALILLSKINRLDLLKVFSTILIPFAVKKEILQKKQEKEITAETLSLEQEFSKSIKILKAKKIKNLPLGTGEKEAISLCLQENLKIFISDDKKARKFARTFGLKTIGIIGILLQNLQTKKITKDESINLLNSLIEKGYYLSPQLYSDVLNLLK